MMLSYSWKMVHLASVHSQEEDDFIGEYVRKASGLPKTPGYWIGYNDIEREGQFVWSDGSVSFYNNWWTNEPNNNGDEDCVERFYFRSKWNDIDCNDKIRFVCKM